MGRKRLSREVVVAAALDLAGEEGLSSLSSRALAARLDVTPMALYWHVRDMDEVVGAVVDQMLVDLGTPSPREDWGEWLEELAAGLRRLLRAEPEALALFTRRPVTSPAARHRLQVAIEVLGSGGFSAETARQAYAAVHTFTIGFCALEEGRRQTPVPDGPLDAPDDASSIAIRGFVSEEQFVLGLRALVAGLAPSAEGP